MSSAIRYVLAFIAALPTVADVFAAPPQANKPYLPEILFCSSGDDATVELPKSLFHHIANKENPVLLKVFGQTLTQLTPKAGIVRFRVPEVRTTTPLAITTNEMPAVVLAEVFVYPKKFQMHWDRADSLRVTTPPTRWLTQWLDAVGLPYEVVEINQLPPKAKGGMGGLLLVNGSVAGANNREFDQRFRKPGQNVLLLSATWLGTETGEDDAIERIVPASLSGPLEALSTESWSRPVSFHSRREAWPGIVNRRTWIAGRSVPLVEDLSIDWKRGTVVASYVPWQRQLGRNELADALFVGLLQAACKQRRPAANWQSLRIRYPATGKSQGVGKGVLERALECQSRESPQPNLDVFDLRGPDDPGLPIERIVRDIGISARQTPVLVLGSDADGRIRASISRMRKSSKKHPHSLTWIATDRQPASIQDQIHLMEVLTTLRIQLGTLSSAGVMK